MVMDKREGTPFPSHIPLKEGYSVKVFKTKKYAYNTGAVHVDNLKGLPKREKESGYIPFLKDIVKEVGRLPYRKKRIFESKLKIASAIFLPLMTVGALATKAHATGLDQLIPYMEQRVKLNQQLNQQIPTVQTPIAPQPNYNAPQAGEEMIPVDGNIVDKVTELGILPVEIVDLLVNIVVTCGILGIFLAMVCLIAAGGFGMMGQAERAKTWTRDVIKGLGQILLAPVIILLLAFITSSALSNIDVLDLFY